MAGKYPVRAAYMVFDLLFACQQVVFYGAKAFSFYNKPDSAFAVRTELIMPFFCEEKATR